MHEDPEDPACPHEDPQDPQASESDSSSTGTVDIDLLNLVAEPAVQQTDSTDRGFSGGGTFSQQLLRRRWQC